MDILSYRRKVFYDQFSINFILQLSESPVNTDENKRIFDRRPVELTKFEDLSPMTFLAFFWEAKLFLRISTYTCFYDVYELGQLIIRKLNHRRL